MKRSGLALLCVIATGLTASLALSLGSDQENDKQQAMTLADARQLIAEQRLCHRRLPAASLSLQPQIQIGNRLAKFLGSLGQKQYCAQG